MMKTVATIVCLLTVAACVVTAALAQDEAPPIAMPPNVSGTFAPVFERRPDAGAPARVIPAEALRRQQAGAAILCCRPRADRTLECETGWEAPSGFGFGRSGARFIASMQQLTEASYADYLTQSDRLAFPQLMQFRFEGAADAPTPPPQDERQALCDAVMPVAR
jgi:hypothetical protein